MVEELFQEEGQVVNIILIVVIFLLLMAVAMVLFFVLSRRRIIKTELEKANLEIEYQKEILQSTIVTQEEERQRIAQDMHDAISSKLNVVSLHANMLTDTNNAPGETKKIADNIVKVTSTVLENSRKIAHDLLPPTLQKFGLAAAMEELCDEVIETGRFEVHGDFNYSEGCISEEKELHLFRIAQELISNAIKYSEAKTLTLELVVKNKQLCFKYKDDGKGFDLANARLAKGLGLSGIRNRVEILNAQLEMQSEIGNGLLVQIFIELD